jgi:hypothetical protein
MPDTISDLKRRLAENAEAVCRYYLCNGRRAGNYWIVGDVRNTPGRSLYVRLRGPPSGPGAAGRWRDAATGERGDLLNLIAATRGLRSMGAILDEARRFLSLPPPESTAYTPTPAGSPETARRLFAASRPIAGTLAEAYLHQRGITNTCGIIALRFHPNCYYRREKDTADEMCTAAPALIAAATALDGKIMGVQRTWLDPTGGGKLPIERPRRAMGHLLGHAVRFGVARDAMAAGEGIETVRCGAVCPACRPPQRSPQGISRPFCFHRDCAGSTSCAITTAPDIWPPRN